MIKPRWYKVLSDLWGNKIRSILVIASIAIGLFAVGMIVSMAIIITDDMKNGYSSVNPANIEIDTTFSNQDLVDRIRLVEGVNQAEGLNVFSLRVNTGQDKWDKIELKAISEIDDMGIGKVELLEGVWPPDNNEIVIDSYKFPDLNARVGDYIDIMLPSGRIRQMLIAGIVHDQTIGATAAGGFFLAPITGYITLETLPWLENPEMMDKFLITVDSGENDPNHIRLIANRVSDEIEDSGRVVTSSAVRASQDHPNRVYVEAITSVLILLGLLVVFLSAFLITNTLSALLNQQVQQIGVMKTIGARRGQIMGIYMVLIFIFSVIAFLIAVPLSSLAGYALLEFLSGKINMALQGYRLIPMAIILQLVIAILVPQAAGFLPISHGTRISAVEAFSGNSFVKPTKSKDWLNSSLKKIRGLSRPQLISIRNTFRSKGRTALTLFTLTLGGAIFIATFNVQGSLNNYIGRISNYFMADINLTMHDYYRVDEIQDIVGEVPGIERVEGWASTIGEVVMPDGSVGESVTILGPPANTKLVEPILLEGRWVTQGDENAIAVNERFRELFPDLKVGDILRLKIIGNEKDLIVVGFFQLSGKSGGFTAYAPYDYLSEITHKPMRATTYRISSKTPGLSIQDQGKLGQQIEVNLKKYGFSVKEISEGQSLSETTSDGLGILTGFLLIMSSMIAVVGSIGLAGTMSMNVLERTREIGIIRSIGASDKAVMILVLVEGVIIGLLSWLLGTILALPISTLLSNTINLALFGAVTQFTFTLTGVIVWLVVVLGLSVLASIIPARNAARLTIREVLSYE